MAKSNIDAILLDLDGTVVDTLELIFQSYHFTMRNCFGCDGLRRIWEQCVGMHLHDIFRTTLIQFDKPVSDRLLADATTMYREHLRSNEAAVTTFPGMRDSLIELVRRGRHLAIVTTKNTESARRHLHSQELTHLFDVVIGSDQCQNHKPHPEPFQKALAEMGMSPTQAIGIGDSEHDIRSARAAGMKTIAACWGTLSRDKLLAAEPDMVAESPVDLLSMIR